MNQTSLLSPIGALGQASSPTLTVPPTTIVTTSMPASGTSTGTIVIGVVAVALIAGAAYWAYKQRFPTEPAHVHHTGRSRRATRRA